MSLPLVHNWRDNNRSAWSNTNNEDNSGEPCYDSDQMDVTEEEDTGLGLDLSSDLEPWELPLKTKDGKLCPLPDHPYGGPTHGTLNNYDGSHLDEILKSGVTLTCYKNFERGSQDLNDHKIDQYICLEDEFSGQSEDNQHQNCEPNNLTYVPSAHYVPNRMLSAINIFPYAMDEEHREHHFMAYGVTLATKNHFGKLVYYNGDTNI